MESTSFWSNLETFDSKVALSSSNVPTAEEAEALLAKHPFQAIFGAIILTSKSKNGETKLRLLCKVLERLFRSPNGAKYLVSAEVAPCLAMALTSNVVRVRTLALNSISQGLKKENTNSISVLLSDTVLRPIAKCLLVEDTEVAELAAETFFCAVQLAHDDTMRAKFVGHLKCLYVDKEKGEVDTSTIIARVISLTVKIATLSRENEKYLHVLRTVGVLEPIYEHLQGQDVLLQLAIIETLPQLATTVSGVSYLLESGILDILFGMFGFSGNDDFNNKFSGMTADLCAGVAIVVIGNVAKFSGLGSDEESIFLRCVERAMKGECGEQAEIAALEQLVLWSTASEESCKRLLKLSTEENSTDKDCEILKSIVRTWLSGGNLNSSNSGVPVEKKISSWSAFTKVCSTSRHDDAIVSVLWDGFGGTAGVMGAILRGDASNPHLSDERSVFRVVLFSAMAAIAQQNSGWGLRRLFAFRGFEDFLIDGATEKMSDCRRTKFDIIRAVLKCSSKETIGQERLEKVGKVFEKGWSLWGAKGRRKDGDTIATAVR